MKPLGQRYRYAPAILAAAVVAGPAAAGSVDLVAFFETGSAWFDPTSGAADRAAVDAMLNQFEAILQTPGGWDASIEVFLYENGTGAFASTFSNNSASVSHNGSTYQATGAWREINLGAADDNGSTVNLSTGAGAETVIDWNFSLSSPSSNLGLLRHELMHSFGMTSFLGNEMPTMAQDGTITTNNVGGSTSATVYDAHIVDLNGNTVVGTPLGGISHTVNDYAVDSDWDDNNGSGLAFVGIADDGSDMLLRLTSSNSEGVRNGTGIGTRDGSVQASHPAEVSYANAHPTWNTLVEVDRAFLRGLGYTLVGDTTSVADLNADGFVGIEDLDLLLANWGGAGGSPINGDANSDGAVNQLDLDIVTDAWGDGTPPAGVIPAPTSAALLGLAGLALLRRRRPRDCSA